MRELSKRTLGELGAMRDSLYLASQDIGDDSRLRRFDPATRTALLRVIDVLAAIVNDTPYARTPEEYERLRAK